MLELDGQGGLARGGESGQPDCETLLVAQLGALAAGQGAGVEGDVAVFRGLVLGYIGIGLVFTYVDILEGLWDEEKGS